jgi:uncharacterized protein (UPF0332 family)
MTPHKDELIKLAVDKSNRALQDAKDCIESDKLETALNRIYYAVFYAVCALAVKNGFSTSKHSALKGWFNRKFVYEEHTFDDEMYRIYEDAFAYRQKSDYDLLYIPSKENTENLFVEVKKFTENIICFLSING